MLQKLYIVAAFVFGLSLYAEAQTRDSLDMAIRQTSPKDSTLTGPSIQAQVKLSDDKIQSKVEYGARDSARYDDQSKRFFLYGDAYVQYEEYSIKAHFIELDMKTNIATASGHKDSLGNWIGKPLFTQKEKSFAAAKMRFNFKTKKGIIYEVVTKENDIFLHGSRTKFVAKDEDSGRAKDIIYNENAVFTTCNNEIPHYGIRSTKQKLIPDELVVVGPSRLEVAGIPTPFWLPFGFFPTTATQKRGVLIPRDYEFSPEWGYGLRNIGYFMPLGEYANLQTTFDIYTRGAYRINLSSQYKKNYKFSGNISVNFANLISEDRRTAAIYRNKGWVLRWTHNQDSRAHPTRSFGGTINIQSNNFDQQNFNDAASQLTNTYRSALNYSKIFSGTPFSLTAGVNHSQNTRTRQMEISLPNLVVKMTRINPFKSKNSTGPQKWYERLTLNYDLNLRGLIRAPDSLLFSQETFDNAQLALQHRASSGLNFKIFKYINLTPSVDYSETYSIRSVERYYDPSLIFDTIMVNNEPVIDTIPGSIKRRTINDLNAYRTAAFRTSISTQLYGTLLFGKGKIRGIRHVIRPNISFSWTPDNQNVLNDFTRIIDTTGIPILDRPLEYNILEESPFRPPSRQTGRSNINYTFDNNIEVKYYSKKDSITKRFKLFDRLNFSGSYNLEADSFRWSPLGINAFKRIFGGRTNVSLNMSYDFYDRINGVRQRDLYWNTKRKVLRFDNARLSVNTSFKLSELFQLFLSDAAYKKSFFYLFDAFNIRHNFVATRRENLRHEMENKISTNSLSTNGRIPLSPKWNLSIRQIGYDFQQKRITYPDIGFVRDLHCWEMSISTQPVRGTYTFSIYVKPGTLGFLRLPYNRGLQDTRSKIF